MTYTITEQGSGRVLAHVPLPGGGLGVYPFRQADDLRAFLTAIEAEPDADADRLRELYFTIKVGRRPK